MMYLKDKILGEISGIINAKPKFSGTSIGLEISDLESVLGQLKKFKRKKRLEIIGSRRKE